MNNPVKTQTKSLNPSNFFFFWKCPHFHSFPWQTWPLGDHFFFFLSKLPAISWAAFCKEAVIEMLEWKDFFPKDECSTYFLGTQQLYFGVKWAPYTCRLQNLGWGKKVTWTSRPALLPVCDQPPWLPWGLQPPPLPQGTWSLSASEANCRSSLSPPTEMNTDRAIWQLLCIPVPSWVAPAMK